LSCDVYVIILYSLTVKLSGNDWETTLQFTAITVYTAQSSWGDFITGIHRTMQAGDQTTRC